MSRHIIESGSQTYTEAYILAIRTLTSKRDISL